MLKLGQRAWNNILIFVMLFMVYLFSVSNNLINNASSEDSTMRLLPPYSVIMSMQFADVQIERIGQDWRFDNANYSVETLATIVNRWEVLEVRPVQYTPDGNPYVITMKLAGEENPRVIQLFHTHAQPVLSFQGNMFKVIEWTFAELVVTSSLQE